MGIAIAEALPHSGNRLVAPGKRPKGVPPWVKGKRENGASAKDHRIANVLCAGWGTINQNDFGKAF